MAIYASTHKHTYAHTTPIIIFQPQTKFINYCYPGAVNFDTAIREQASKQARRKRTRTREITTAAIVIFSAYTQLRSLLHFEELESRRFPSPRRCHHLQSGAQLNYHVKCGKIVLSCIIWRCSAINFKVCTHCVRMSSDRQWGTMMRCQNMRLLNAVVSTVHLCVASHLRQIHCEFFKAF